MIPSTPELKHVLDLKRRYIEAFQNWFSVPDAVIRITASQQGRARAQICAQLEEVWHKLHQDMSAVLHLVGGNYLGPPAALSRICKENALRMLQWAFADPDQDQMHLHLFRDVQPKREASRLERDMKAFLESATFSSNPEIRRQLEQAISYAQDTQRQDDRFPCDIASYRETKGFAKVAHVAGDRLSKAGIDPSIIPILVRDYWMESEVVHTGVNSHLMYQPQEFGLDLERNGQMTCLSLLRDLYVIKPIVLAALLCSANLVGQLPKAPEAIRLERIAEEAEKLVQATLTRYHQTLHS